MGARIRFAEEHRIHSPVAEEAAGSSGIHCCLHNIATLRPGAPWLCRGVCLFARQIYAFIDASWRWCWRDTQCALRSMDAQQCDVRVGRKQSERARSQRVNKKIATPETHKAGRKLRQLFCAQSTVGARHKPTQAANQLTRHAVPPSAASRTALGRSFVAGNSTSVMRHERRRSARADSPVRRSQGNAQVERCRFDAPNLGKDGQGGHPAVRL